MGSEVASRADFSEVRYAQCWEDADILLDALDVGPGRVCLSIASAGDNTLSLLARGPARVVALDLNPSQLACLELRVAAYRTLTHPELLELIGSVPSTASPWGERAGRGRGRRAGLYAHCRPVLSEQARAFWDAHPGDVAAGVGGAGKFERYFRLFRTCVLPLVHSRRTARDLLRGGPPAVRRRFYARRWDTWRWRLMFRLFFSRFVMGRLGRDPAFFKYVEGDVAGRIRRRVGRALTELDPADNPYLHWVLTGRHGRALPFALRPENFGPIRDGLDRLEWHCQSVEDYLDGHPDVAFDCYNLSDIFEYMSPESYHRLLARLAERGRRGGRLAYWNMLAPRSRPESMADKLRPLTDLAERLFAADKAAFYRRFVVEEIV
jgi:S-adenosylmethionine-diacylglycerol 3-amino-3-carboxypropyl transferase